MNLFSLQLKETFRAPQWEAKLSIKIIMALVMIYFLGAFVFGASMAYPILYKKVLDREPVEVFNGVLLYIFFFELVLRFFLQQLPVTNIQALILLPFKKRKIINHVLLRSIFSGFNTNPLIIYLPFAISMYRDDYLGSQVMAWWFVLVLVTLCLNFLIYIVNKNNVYFVLLLAVIALTVALDFYTQIDLGHITGALFDAVVAHPQKAGLFIFPLLLSYALVFYFLKRGFYMDAGLSKKKVAVRTGDYSFLNFLGDDALFLKNDLRMIIRNVRPRQIVLMSFLFLFYGLIFFTQDIYRNQDFVMVFAGLFVTGGFSLTFGNYVPAWDSSYYKLLMTHAQAPCNCTFTILSSMISIKEISPPSAAKKGLISSRASITLSFNSILIGFTFSRPNIRPLWLFSLPALEAGDRFSLLVLKQYFALLLQKHH